MLATALLTILALAVSATCSAAPATAGGAPCAQISRAYQQWAANGGKGIFAGIPGQTAYDCLRSMPFRPDLALRFIDEWTTYLTQFHSTLELLKRPPRGYMSPSVDLMHGFDKIRKRVGAGHYTSQFDFDTDVKTLLARANDGHLQAALCSLQLIHFDRGLPLVSVSEDGRQLPYIYTYHDAELKANGVQTVSPVVEINGVDAVYYLEANIGILLGFQDPDTRYNRLFPSPTANFSGAYSGGAWTSHEGLWPGVAASVLKFANGTKTTVETTASWSQPNGPMVYASGEALFNAACLPNANNTLLGTGMGTFRVPFQITTQVNHNYTIPGSGPAAPYPDPVARDPHDRIRGYYLTDPRFSDVAVLQVPHFRVGKTGGVDFARTASEFLTRAAMVDGKTKLLLDLSGNDGGHVAPGFNLFRLLFPDRPIYSATRFRATELVDIMGRVFSAAYGADYRGELPLDPPLIANAAVGPDQKHIFQAWDGLYGPTEILGINMSALYAHFDLNTASSETDPIAGFGGVPLNTTRLFKQEDIVIVTDGHCASTCALLAGLLKKEGVRSIAFGGRPRKGRMQAVGGVKGGQYWSFSTISSYIAKALELAGDILPPEQLARLRELAPPPPSNFSLKLGPYGESSVNFRDAYADYDGDTLTPRQFVYEPADCHLFFTAENIIWPGTTWVAAAEAMFGNGSCAQ
ncbi:hypothetical protein QBC46DRAFT_397395 [Diplogelasinospora grovesii]|uniref:Tail specific protease domain-containing protein n=1 Tax=Diplogelasinospora grovesii TaxID=303347 RepID=A0AAN6S0G5_9PEZI|nr:hypothetical protein QBC46DRAFT_397395 [Diplogelasinospora grovesii]